MASVSSFDPVSDKYVVMYEGDGANEKCAAATKAILLDRLPVDSRISILDTDMSLLFKNRVADRTIVVIPGGSAMRQTCSFRYGDARAGCSRDLERFLSEGGNVHATCAGAISLSSGLFSHYGKLSDKPFPMLRTDITLNLFSSQAKVPLRYSDERRDLGEMFYTNVTLSNDPSFPESLREKTVRFVDADSPYWSEKGDATVMGWYTSTKSKEPLPAIMTKEVGLGKVWAQCAHLEFKLSEVSSYTGVAILTKPEQDLRMQLFYHSFRTLGLRI